MVRDDKGRANNRNYQPAKEPLEIERKFLIRYPDLSELERLCRKKAAISQTYLQSEPGITRRIRRSEVEGKTVYWYTEKEKLSDMTRIEREQEISEEEYQAFQKEARKDARPITKNRYYLPSGSLCFEIDVFPEWTDRAYAEVELDAEEEAFDIPSCLQVIKEVTNDKRYTNASLARNGFPYEAID